MAKDAARVHSEKAVLGVKRQNQVDTVQAHKDDAQVVTKMSDRKGVVSGVLFSMEGIRKEFVRRLFACLEAKGGHFEHCARTLLAHRAEKAMAEAGLLQVADAEQAANEKS